MKQGRTEKAVFAKLSTQKVELAQNKIELSVADNLQKGISNIKAEIKRLDSAEASFESAYDAFEDAKDRLITIVGDSTDVSQNQIDIVNKTEAAAKELGVAAKDVKGYNELVGLILETQGMQSALRKRFLR
jgi:hypothetical protein